MAEKKVTFPLKIDPDTHEKLRIMCFEQRISMQKLLNAAVNALLEGGSTNGTEPLAQS